MATRKRKDPREADLERNLKRFDTPKNIRDAWDRAEARVARENARDEANPPTLAELKERRAKKLDSKMKRGNRAPKGPTGIRYHLLD